MTTSSYKAAGRGPNDGDRGDGDGGDADGGDGRTRLNALRVRSPGELLEAFPAMFGFPPDESLVLLGRDRRTGRCGTVGRIDLDYFEDELSLATLQQIHAVAERMEPDDAVFAFLISSGLEWIEGYEVGQCASAPSELVPAGPAFWGLGSRGAPWLYGAIAEVGVAVTEMCPPGALERLYVCSAIGPGARWLEVAPCHDGLLFVDGDRLEDPAISPAMTAAVCAGRQMVASRAELAAMLAPETPLGPALRRGARREVAASDDRHLAAEMVAMCCPGAAGVDAADGGVPEPARLAFVAAAVLRPAVRDVVTALAHTDFAAPALELLCATARVSRGSERAAAAALAASWAYCRAEGVLTSVFLEAARDADPRLGLAALLEHAYYAGLPPETFAEIVSVGVATAARLGVELPPITWGFGAPNPRADEN